MFGRKKAQNFQLEGTDMPDIVRQGDVLLRRVKRVTEVAKVVPRDGGRVILAYGEVTGHAHAIDSPLAELFEERDGKLYLKVSVGTAGTEPVRLVHEEHSAITLEPGVYEVIHQREYDPVRDRRVID